MDIPTNIDPQKRKFLKREMKKMEFWSSILEVFPAAFIFIGIERKNIVSIIFNLLVFVIFFFYFWNINKINKYSNVTINPDNGIAIVKKHNPSFFSIYDISQSRYNIVPFYSDKIDTICIDLGTIAEFSPQDLLPDRKTLSSIIFTDKSKINQIREKGLDIYVRYPELQNTQSVRIYLVTAFLTLVLQSLIKKTGTLIQFIFNNYQRMSKTLY